MSGSRVRRTDTPFDVACRLLARRPHTAAELAARLEQLGYRKETAARTVARLRERGAIDDRSLAMSRARTLRARGQGSYRIAADLARRGVPAEVAAEAVAASLEGKSETDYARRALGALGLSQQLTEKDRARAWRRLLSRGFPPEVASAVVGDGGD